MNALVDPKGFRPLLPAGVHPTDWQGLQRLCVEYFPGSAARARMMNALSMLARLVNEASIPARLWISGDFLTERDNPQDCSVTLVLVESVYSSLSVDQLDFFHWFRQADLFQEHRCETYGIVLDAGRADWEILHKYWLNQYGLGRPENRIGIAEILVPTLSNQ